MFLKNCIRILKKHFYLIHYILFIDSLYMAHSCVPVIRTDIVAYRTHLCIIFPFLSKLIWYANGVHMSAVLENTAQVQGIRCEPLGEHLIPRTCAVFFLTARKWTAFAFSQTTVQIFQRRREMYSWPTWQTTIIVVNRRRSFNSIHLLYSLYATYIHVVQRSAVLADTDIRLIVKTQPVSVRISHIAPIFV